MWGISSAGRALAWHARGQRFDPAILHQKSTVLRRKYGAFLFAEADFWGLHCFACTVFRLLQAVPIQPPTFDVTPFSKKRRGRLPQWKGSSAFFISCFLMIRPTCSAAAYSHCFSTSFSLFRSSGLAICSFMPVFLASCTSSAKAFAVMAMMGTLPRLPGRERIAAVAS